MTTPLDVVVGVHSQCSKALEACELSKKYISSTYMRGRMRYRFKKVREINVSNCNKLKLSNRNITHFTITHMYVSVRDDT